MTTRRDLDKAYDPAGPVLAKDTIARLDALVRRFGGKPKPIAPPSKMVLPAVGKRRCEGQLEIGFDGPDEGGDP